jgi:hypothetical protein
MCFAFVVDHSSVNLPKNLIVDKSPFYSDSDLLDLFITFVQPPNLELKILIITRQFSLNFRMLLRPIIKSLCSKEGAFYALDVMELYDNYN